jgi:hypothetical protein
MERSDFVSLDRRPGTGSPRRPVLDFLPMLTRPTPPAVAAGVAGRLLNLPRAEYIAGLLRWGAMTFEARWLVLPGWPMPEGHLAIDTTPERQQGPRPGTARNPEIGLTPPNGRAGILCIHRLVSDRMRAGLALPGGDWAAFHDRWRPLSAERRPQRLWIGRGAVRVV